MQVRNRKDDGLADITCDDCRLNNAVFEITFPRGELDLCRTCFDALHSQTSTTTEPVTETLDLQTWRPVRWEYKKISVTNTNFWFSDILNKLGNQGWELVSERYDIGAEASIHIFKRPKQ